MAFNPSIDPSTLPQGLAVSGISSVGGQMANQKTVRTLFDYNPFAIYRTVAQRHDDFPSFRLLLRMQNAARRVNAPTTGHYEQDWKTNLVEINTVQTAAGGAGNDIVLNLATGSMYNASATIGGSARQASFVRQFDVLQAPDGVRALVTAKTTSVTPHRITLTPLSAADDLDASFLASSTYAIFDNMHPEGGGLPESIVPRITKYTNTFQIIKEASSITGTEATNQTFVQFTPGVDGSIFAVMEKNAMYRYERAMCYALLFGTQADNLTNNNTIVGNDVDITGTEGLVPFIEQNGHTDNYTAGAYDITDFDNLAVIFRQERVGTYQVVTYDGFSVFQDTENALQGQLNANLSVELMHAFADATGVPRDVMQPTEGDDLSLYVGFRGIKKSGYHFHFRMIHEFDEVVGAGATGYDYPQYRLAIPLGTTKDKASGSVVPYISYEYKGLNGFDRHDLVGTFAGVGADQLVGGRASDQYDRMQMGIVSEIAGHFACPNRCVVQKPS